MTSPVFPLPSPLSRLVVTCTHVGRHSRPTVGTRMLCAVLLRFCCAALRSSRGGFFTPHSATTPVPVRKLGAQHPCSHSRLTSLPSKRKCSSPCSCVTRFNPEVCCCPPRLNFDSAACVARPSSPCLSLCRMSQGCTARMSFWTLLASVMEIVMRIGQVSGCLKPSTTRSIVMASSECIRSSLCWVWTARVRPVSRL